MPSSARKSKVRPSDKANSIGRRLCRPTAMIARVGSRWSDLCDMAGHQYLLPIFHARFSFSPSKAGTDGFIATEPYEHARSDQDLEALSEEARRLCERTATACSEHSQTTRTRNPFVILRSCSAEWHFVCAASLPVQA